MKIDLPPDLADFVNTLAARNEMTPEQVIVQIIETEQSVIEAKTGRGAQAKVNLAKFDRTKFVSHVDQGREARQFFGIDALDGRSGPFLVYVPDDLPSMSLKFFAGLFEQSIMMLGPKRFLEHYVFDADVGNLVMIDRYVRTVWSKVKDTEIYRISVSSRGEGDANYTVWLKIRDEVTQTVIDETPVGDYDNRDYARLFVELRQGRVIDTN